MNWQAAKDLFHFAAQMPSGFTILIGTALIAWAIWGHVEGFAHTDELEKVQQDIVELKQDIETINIDRKASRRESLEAQMFSTRVEQCRATGDMKRVFANRLADLERKYDQADGWTYRVPDCKDL